DVGDQVEVQAKYQGYIDKQLEEIHRVRRLENRPIPSEFDYQGVTGLRNEAREKLLRFRPATVGQASRIMGVNPADLSILLVHLERSGRSASGVG
ncbi:MAG: tRNA uridine-5-carboxymethylaminomethyl(34) synthesis enzyme MnmG, partial [Chloroflexi bacterium]|nr:tRNA uridine-5-carboxymethylaminomethyl(34) synthesis enzyme MnmG [Chloroflexota bacterium]